MATRIYKTPFAATGDKEPLATADQPDGKVSLQAGWTPDYELPNDNANYRPVGRGEMNGIIGEITEGLGDVQLHGFATWQAIDGGWPVGAHVFAGGVIYRSDADNNTTNPGTGGAGWSQPFAGRLLNVRVFNTPGTTTYTPTPGTKRIIAHIQGGGGGGGGSEGDAAGTIAAGAGGGSGSYAYFTTTTVPSGATLTVGAGGVGGIWPTDAGIGGAGGSSSIGVLVTAPGGLGGSVGRSAVNTTAGPSNNGGAGGAAPSGATYGSAGGNGNAGLYINAGALTGAGADSRYGSGGAMSGASTAGLFGALPATGFGAGGAGTGRDGSAGSGTGGAGSPGIIVIEEYA
ncbi:hypothetical protein [Achromobacter ruhlandii]|uniref:glycine-rich domain-containing protein n=1 Tax=Achromobacter ruhlandii TaxID=72557 RepID=UPI000AA50AE5|nr:hypothetical protein [Achromobacter ruhlandii]